MQNTRVVHIMIHNAHLFLSIFLCLTCINFYVSQAGALFPATDVKSSNPFDTPFDTDLEPNNEVGYGLSCIYNS